MKYTFSQFLTAVLFLLFLFGMGLTFLSPDPEYVISERRKAAPLPEMDGDSLQNGSFSQDFESYLLDTIPLREPLRRLKNQFTQKVLHLSDVDGKFLTENGIAEDLSPANITLAENTAATFDRILSRYFEEKRGVYLAFVPDKAYYARKQGARLDCEALCNALDSGMVTPHELIDLTSNLSLFSYYKTDIHWKQETLFPVVSALGNAMGFTPLSVSDYDSVTLGSFTGTLGAQAALGHDEDELTLLYDRQSILADAIVTYPDGSVAGLYDTALFETSFDKYDVFLRGETVGDEDNRVGNFFVKIQNPHAISERKLILFRDSFARSLVPLLLPAYSEIILVDLRAKTAFYGGNEGYLTSDENTDILFLISAHTLNTTAIQ